MIRETARLLASQGLKRPGILATDGTIQSGLYQKEFEAVGIQATVPTPPAPEAGHVPDLRRCEVRSGRGPPEVRRHPPGPGGTGLRLRRAGLHRSCPSLPTGTTCLPSTQTPWPSWPSGRSRPAASPCGTSSSNSVKHRDFVSGPAGRLKIGLPGTNTISSLSTLKSRCSSWRTF